MEKNKEEQFLKIPYDILQNKQLHAGLKITLALVYSFHNNKKEMYMSYAKMALRMGVSRTTAIDRINELRDMGYVETKDIGNRRRIITPIRMVEIPTKVVDVPTKVVDRPTIMVDVPTSDSRHTDQEVVGVVGAIRYPILDETLEKPLNSVLDTELNKENPIEHRSVGEIQYENKSKLRKKILDIFQGRITETLLFKYIASNEYNLIEQFTQMEITPTDIELFQEYNNAIK